MRRPPIQGNQTIKLRPIPLDQEDVYIWAKMGVRFDFLAQQYYGDKNYWWILRHVNPDSFGLNPTPGTQIRIPSNRGGRLSRYIEAENL